MTTTTDTERDYTELLAAAEKAGWYKRTDCKYIIRNLATALREVLARECKGHGQDDESYWWMCPTCSEKHRGWPPCPEREP